MGDRGNIVLTGFHGSDRGEIYLYTHWGGSEIYGQLAQTLDSKRARNRWANDAYLARYIAEDLWQPAGGETGFGLSLSPPDNEHTLVVVDLSRQTVVLRNYGLEDAIPKSFQEYIDLVNSFDPDEIEANLVMVYRNT